jgi:hypothetical protein
MKRTVWMLVVLLFCAFEAKAQDIDGDGVLDAIDNCSLKINKQWDPDLDGYGNPCDADFDQDGDVDQADFDILNSGQCGSICDLDENGTVGDFGDFGAFSSLVGSPPGPSGLACAGTVPCTAPSAVPALGDAARGGLLLILIAGAFAMRRRRVTAC